MADDVVVAELDQFTVTRRGNLVYLDVAVDARKYRQLLDVYHDPESWN